MEKPHPIVDPVAVSLSESLPDDVIQYVTWVADLTNHPIKIHANRMELSQSDSEAAEIVIDSTNDLAQLWVLQREEAAGIIEASPVGEPNQVSMVAGTILDRYQVSDGRVQLAGCMFDAKPFLRVTVLDRLHPRIVHHWFDSEGRQIDAQQQDRLGFREIAVADRQLKPSDRATVDAWIETARKQLDSVVLIGAAVVWCRRISGKVSFHFDNGADDAVEFEGWVRDFVTGTAQAPKYRCAVSGIESYNLVSLPDGTISVAEAIGVCDRSGTITHLESLGRCSVSGQSVLKEHLTTCPVTGALLLPSFLVECEWCQRGVAPDAIADGLCSDCRNPVAIDPSEDWIEELTQANPKYAKMKRWTGWIREDMALLIGQRWLNECLVVLHRNDGKTEIHRTGSRSRLSRVWQFDAATGASDTVE